MHSCRIFVHGEHKIFSRNKQILPTPNGSRDWDVLEASCNLKVTGLHYFLWPCVKTATMGNIWSKTCKQQINRGHAKVFLLKSRNRSLHAAMMSVHACKEIIRTFSKPTAKEITATQSVSNRSAFNKRFSLGTGLLLNK